MVGTFKKTAENAKESGKITLIKPSHWSKDSVNYGYNNNKDGRVVISEIFDIEEDGVKKKSSSIPENDKGWKVIEYSAPLMLDKIEGSFPDTDIAMFQNIHVALDSILDPWPVIKGMAARKEERMERKMMEPYKEKFGPYFSTPEELGLIPLRIDKYEDGSSVEHYKDFRIYKKPNGDFARAPQKPDFRDPNTMEIKSGMNIRNTADEYVKGAYQLTLPNGLQIKSKGFLKEVIKFKNGDSLTIKKNKDLGPNLFFRFTLAQFARPNNNTLEEVDVDEKICDTKNELYEMKQYNYVPSYELSFSSNTIDPLKLIYKRKGWITDNEEKGNDEVWAVNGVIEQRDVFLNQVNKSVSLSPITYVITDNGLLPTTEAMGGLLYHHQPITKVIKVPRNQVIYYANGDSITECSITKLNLRDGSKIEYFPEMRKYRIDYPNGDFFVGHINSTVLLASINTTELSGIEFKPTLTYGMLNKSDGSKIEYIDGLPKEEYEAKQKAERAAQEARMKAEEAQYQAERAAKKKEEDAKWEATYRKLCQKYGKANVDNALSSNYKVGMSMQMIKDMK